MANTSASDDTEGKKGPNAAHALPVLGVTSTAVSKYYREAEEALMEAHRMYSRTGNDLEAANALTCLADAYLAQSKNYEARKAFTEAHEIHSRIGNDMGVANTLIILGGILWAESKYDEASKAYTEAHEIHSRLGSELGVANALLGLGDFHRVKSRYSEAEKAYTEAHKVHSRIGNDDGAANALRGLGQVYRRQSKHSEAEKAFKEAHDIYDRIGNDLFAAITLDYLGDVYEGQSKYGEAEKVFTQAHESHARLGNGPGDAAALDRLGQIYMAQSQYGKAEKVFAEAHKIYSHLGDDLGAADALRSLGQSYGQQMKHRETEQAFMEAHEIFSRVGDDAGAADALNGLGQVYGHQSKHLEAENAFMKAHEIHSRLGNSVGVANALLGLGGTYRAQSRNPEAEKALNDAHKIDLPIDDSLHIGNVSRSLGMLAQNQYRYNEAEFCYRRALAAYDRAGHADGRARTLLVLGKLQYAQQKYLDAEEAVSESLAIWSSLTFEEGCALSYLLLAQIFKSQSKNAEAKDAIMKAGELFDRVQGVTQAEILTQLGAECVEQGMYAEAEEHYQVAEAIYSSMGNARGEAAVLRSLGQLYSIQGRDQEVEKCFAQAQSAYPNDADGGGEVKAWQETIEAYPLLRKILNKVEAWALQPSKLGKTKGADMEAWDIYMREELQDTVGQNQDKAREILNQISRYRMDPTSIKMMDTIPRAKGGQGAVLIGTLSLSTNLVEMLPMMREVQTMLGLAPGIDEKFSIDRGRIDNRISNQLAKYAALGIPPELINKGFQEVRMGTRMLERWKKESSEPPSELKVAVKVLAWKRDDPTKFFKSFAHEVSLMAKLSHPNIVDLLGFVEDMKKGDARIILAWEENGNVREFLLSGQWDIPERISLIKDTVSGLEYLHTQQPPICHGDLKSPGPNPAIVQLNILVNSYYHAIITDFGSARIRQSVASEMEEVRPSTSTQPVADSNTSAGFTSPQAKFNPSTSDLTLTGPGFSVRWTAPEVLDDGMQDLPSDMWAMGWICWEIVTGKLPFEELERETAIIMHTITGKLPAIKEDTDLSHVLGLCSLMSNCWLLEANKRVTASNFRLEVRDIPSKTPSGDNSGGKKVRSAALLLELGKMHQFQSNHPAQAEVHYQEALDIATRTKNEEVKANTLFYLGEVLSLQSKYPETEQALSEAHQVFSRLRNNLGAATALYDLGKLYVNWKKYHEAEKAFMEAHETFSRISRHSALAYEASDDSDLGAADTLYHLGHLYREQEKYREAEDMFGKARKIYSRLGRDPGVAKTLGGLGEVYSAQSRHNEAERVFTESREMYSRAGNDMAMERALWRLGRVYGSQPGIQDAVNPVEEAHKLSPARDDNLIPGPARRFLESLETRVSRDLEDAALQYQQLHRRSLEAEEVLRYALTIGKSIERQTEQRLPLLILSKIYKLQSETDEERDAPIQLDNELTQQNDGGARRADLLTRQGNYSLSQGMYGESEKCYRLAQAVSLSLEDTQQEGNALFGLGTSYACQRRYDEAEDCFAGARAAFASVVNQEDEARALECLVEVYILQDKFDDARVACAEARDLCKTLDRPMRNICLKTRKPPRNLEEMDAVVKLDARASRNAQDSLRAGVLTRFGYDHLRQGAFKDAEECFRLAQSISQNLEMAHERGTALIGLGMLLLAQKQTDEAEACFVQARVEFATIADGIQEATVLDALTMLYNQTGKIGDARKSCTEARDIYLRMGQPMSELWAQNWKRLQDLGSEGLQVTDIFKS
ncbi:hypothetical protein FS837_010363 [Tulasnella sp. UAMH 9824]|nr:hypothetical protein FS837_010363 [Tulasnella sp. UAMH 9824]